MFKKSHTNFIILLFFTMVFHIQLSGCVTMSYNTGKENPENLLRGTNNYALNH